MTQKATDLRAVTRPGGPRFRRVLTKDSLLNGKRNIQGRRGKDGEVSPWESPGMDNGRRTRRGNADPAKHDREEGHLSFKTSIEDESMILRMRKARSTASRAGGYVQHATKVVFPKVRMIEGYRGEYLLRRLQGRVEDRSKTSGC